MEKQLKDYAHLYLGAPCVNSWFPSTHSMHDCCWQLASIDRDRTEKPYKLTDNDNYTWTADIRLILRPLSDMTDEEAVTVHKIGHPMDVNVLGWQVKDYYEDDPFTTAAEFHYLLSRRFDLFGLIPAGLAIDKTQQQHKEGGV